MRDIKFRGKYDFGKRWLYGDLRHIGNIVCIYSGTEANVGSTVDPATVGQFTGLKDAKGKEIYEGDILLYRLPENMIALNNSDKSVVFYGHGMFLVSHGKIEFSVNQVLGVHDDDAVVIGNVHDNPELLEENNARD